MQNFLQFGPRPVIVGRASARKPVCSAAHVPGPLLICPLPDGIQAGAALAHVAGQEGQVNQGAGAVALDILDYVIQVKADGGPVGLPVKPGCLGYFIGRHLSGSGYFRQVQVVQVVQEGSRVLAVLIHPVLLVQPLLQYFLQYPAQQQRLGTGGRPQPKVGVPGEFHFPGINHHQGRALFRRRFDGQSDDVVVFGQIGVEHQDAVGLGQVPDGVGGGAVAQTPLQGQGSFRLQVGRDIHVVGGHRNPGKFLGQVQFLVSAVG